MTRLPTIPVPAVDNDVPKRRYWGDAKPPSNRAEMFSAGIVRNATDDDASTNVAGKVGTLRMYGPIDSWGGYWGISARDVSDALDMLGDVDEIRVRVNSPGGEAWEGLAILNMLRAHPARVVAVVDGLAASAASFIAAGCEETVMSPGTQMMIHDASAFAYGPPAVMEKTKAFLDSVSNSIASLYTEAGGGSDEQWRAAMVEETWYTAQEAVDAGLADRVGVVSDAGETSTAGEDALPSDVEDRFDLSLFNYAGRHNAPAPTARTAGPKHPSATAVGVTNTEGGSAVAFSDAQLTTMRQKLGLPADADETAIVTAVNAVVDESLEERSEPTATTTTELPEGMVLVDSAVLDELRQGATAGREARDRLANQERDRVIDEAIRSGKTTTARRDHWVTSWAADPEGTRQILDSLEPGLAVPVDEAGHGDEPSATATEHTDAALEAFASQIGLTKEALRG